MTEVAVERLMTVDDVASYLQMSRRYVYDHARALRGFKLGRELRFRLADVDAYLRSLRL